MEKLRVIFSKSKNAIFLTHIDVVKIFEESFIRANIQINYFGKNKHKTLISFADPLKKGIESIGEIMEIELKEKIDTTYFIKQINSVLPSGITVLSAEYLDTQEFNLMDRVYASTYLISFIYTDDMFIDKTKKQIEQIKKSYEEKMKQYLEQEKLLVLKKTKNRMERIDVKHDIINYDFLLDGSLEITVCSGLRKRLDPENVMIGYNEYINDNIKYKIKRIKILLGKN